MRRRTKQRMGIIGLVLLAIAVGGLVALTAQSCEAQMVCVTDPIVPGTFQSEREPLRKRVEGWVREKGFQTGCPADWELVVEPLAGRAYSDQVYFVASTSTSPGIVLGTVSVQQPEIRFSSWIVNIHRRGRVLEGEQTLGYSLRGGVRKVLKTVGK